MTEYSMLSQRHCNILVRQTHIGYPPNRRSVNDIGHETDIKYCVARAILDHPSIDEGVRNVELVFDRTGFVTHAEYNFVMGALMNYIVLFNTTRNECVYKMRYGSIWATGESNSTGLQQRVRNIGTEDCYFWIVISLIKTQENDISKARRCTAAQQYRAFAAKLVAEGAHRDAAFLSGHTQRTQVLMYSNTFIETSISGYCLLEELACKEASASSAEIEAAIQQIRIHGLRQCDDENASITEEKVEEETDVAKQGNQVDYSSSSSSDEDFSTLQVERKDVTVLTPLFVETGSAKYAEEILNPNLAKKPRIASDESQHVQIFNEEDIRTLLEEHNLRECTTAPTALTTEQDFMDFAARRRARPIQDFPWIAIRPVPEVRGMGAFAKVDIPRGAIFCDYRGYTGKSETVYGKIDTKDEQMQKRIRNYALEVTVDEGGVKYKMVVAAHLLSYDGSVVLGRYLNHSKHDNCEAVKKIWTSKDNRGNVVVTLWILFKAKRDVKKGEQLLWNYGKEFDTQDFKENCLCSECKNKRRTDTQATESSSVPLEEPSREAWESHFILSQHLAGSGVQPPPLTSYTLLTDVTIRAGLRGLTYEQDSSKSLTSILEESRLLILGNKAKGEDLHNRRSILACLLRMVSAEVLERGHPVKEQGRDQRQELSLAQECRAAPLFFIRRSSEHWKALCEEENPTVEDIFRATEKQ
ncbi:hypothetical protein RB195_010505 [Necator americanus]|uniref:SET domain-containing protein n=1 Tax=Necator americanus TaxID=51031 RepID=A0ABR1CYN5_NECAM